jgi:electron transfer flavoprotein alpha subunit
MTTRVNPNRASKIATSGLKRIVLTTPASLHTSHQQKLVRTKINPKACFLVIAHSERGSLSDHALQTIAAAAILADAETNVLALILGALTDDLANVGADQVIVISELDFEHFQPELELASISALIDSIQPTRIFMPDNHTGDGDLGRRLIARQKTKTAATQVIEMDADHVATYQAGGTLIAQIALPEIILLATNTVDTHLPFTALTQRSKLATGNQASKNQALASPYQDLGMQTIAATEIALEEADFIVSAGNGVQNVATLESLAHALQASIGASRVAVDDGKFSRDKQIGASGKTVSASAYLAIGISGAVQHLQGIKDCRHVIAINTDASAPMVKRADLTVIGDAEEIMRALITLIAEEKSANLKVAA